MLWQLRAELLAGAPDLVMVEMKQVPGYMDFLADIMPGDVSWSPLVAAGRICDGYDIESQLYAVSSHAPCDNLCRYVYLIGVLELESQKIMYNTFFLVQFP